MQDGWQDFIQLAPFPLPTYRCAHDNRLLSMAEGRLSHSDSRAHENDLQASSLRDQLTATMDGLRWEGVVWMKWADCDPLLR